MSIQSIVIIDDEKDLRESLSDILSSKGYQVHCSSDGHEALAYLESQAGACLILVDLMMPSMDGWEFLEKLRTLGEKQGVKHHALIMSGSDAARDIAHQEDAGFVAKPFSAKELVEIIKRY